MMSINTLGRFLSFIKCILVFFGIFWYTKNIYLSKNKFILILLIRENNKGLKTSHSYDTYYFKNLLKIKLNNQTI